MHAEVAEPSALPTAPTVSRPDTAAANAGQHACWTTGDAIDQATSLLAFQARVLGEAEQPRTPLLERVKFLAIVGRNLDEFVMVRSKRWTDVVAERVRQTMVGLWRRADGIFQGDLVPALAREGVVLAHEHTLTATERAAVEAAFLHEVAPHTRVFWADDGRIGPSVPGLGLNAAVEVQDATGRERLAIVRLPDRPSSLVRFTPDSSRGPHVHRPDAVGVVWAADLVLARLARLLPEYTIRAAHVFRLVREGDLVVSANETQPLTERVIDATRRRDTQSVVLLTLPTSMPSALAKQLASIFNVEDRAIIRERDVHDWSHLWDLTRLPRPDLRHRPFTPSRPDALTNRCIFASIRECDHLLHHPYQSFEPVLDLLRAAATDPQVEAISTTLYRTDRDKSPLVDALVSAARRGVHVRAVIELRARFDERRNVQWAQRLKDAGAEIWHGRDGLKVHAKMTVIRRRDADGVRSYVHVSSGNYSTFTSGTYTDVALLTAHPAIAGDVEGLFDYLARRVDRVSTSLVLAAPTGLRQRLLVLIDREIAHARRGSLARLTLKMNALTDPQVMTALCRASEAGVRVDLIVRGVCALRPGVPGLSSRVRVRSIVGRFLEHSRVWSFANGGEEEVFIGSADLMPRNFDRRLEVMVPITTPALAERVRAEILREQLTDPTAYELHPDGSYRRIGADAEPLPSQDRLVALHESTAKCTPSEPSVREDGFARRLQGG